MWRLNNRWFQVWPLNNGLFVKETMMRFKALLSLLILACIGLSGCVNTVEGAGQDISNAGNAISKSVK
jgi:predicted small secreted protein